MAESEVLMTDIMRTRIVQLEDESRSLRAQVVSQTAKLDQAASSAVVLREDAHKVIGQWAEDAKKSRKLAEDLANEKSELCIKLSQAEQKLVEVVSLNATYVKKISESDAIVADAIRLQSDLSHATTRADQLESQMSSQSLACARLESELAVAHSTIAALQCDMQHTSCLLESTHQEQSKWEADCMEALQIAQDLRHERVQQSQRESDLGHQLCVAEGALAAKSSQFDELKIQHAQLVDAKVRLESELQSIGQTLEEHIITVADLQDTQVELRCTVQKLNADMVVAAATLNRLQDEARCQDVAAENFLSTNVALKSQVESLSAALSDSQKENASATAQGTALFIEKLAVDRKLAEACARSDAFESDIVEHMDTIENMKRVLQSVEEQLSLATLRAHESEVAREKIQFELDTVKSGYSRSHDEGLALKAKLEAIHAKNVELELFVATAKAQTTQSQECMDELQKHTIEVESGSREKEAAAAAAYATLSVAHQTAVAALDSLRSEHALAEAHLATCRAELLEKNLSLATHAETSSIEISKLVEEVRQANDDRQTAESLLADSVAKHMKEYDQAVSLTETLRNEVRGLKRANDISDESNLREMVVLQDDLQRTRQELILKGDELRRSKFEQESIVERCKSLEVIVQEHVSTLEDVEFRLQGAKESERRLADALKLEKNSHQQEMAVLKNKLSILEEDCTQLESQRAGALQKFDDREVDLRTGREQHAKLKASFEEAKERCVLAEQSLAKTLDERNEMVRDREQIVLKYNKLYEKYLETKKQLLAHDGTAVITPPTDPPPKVATPPTAAETALVSELSASLREVQHLARAQESELQFLRVQHRQLQQAMEGIQGSTATLDVFHKTLGLSVQTLNTAEGPVRRPKKRSCSAASAQSANSQTPNPHHAAIAQRRMEFRNRVSTQDLAERSEQH